MRYSFGLLLFLCIGVYCAKAENDNPEPLKRPVRNTVEVNEEPNNGTTAPAPAAVKSVQNATRAEEKAEELSPRMLLASRKIARAPSVELPPEGDDPVPDPIKKDETPPVFVPQSIKVISPSRRVQPNKVQRVKEVFELVGKTPMSDLQKDPAKLKEFMKRPTPGKGKPSGDSTEDGEERPVQKPKLPKKRPTPSTKKPAVDSTEDREERPVQKPKVPEKLPAVFEKKPAKLPKSVKFSKDITIVPEDRSSEYGPPVAKPKFVHPVQADHGYALKVRPPKLSKPPKPTIVRDISATYSSEEQRPVFKPKSIRKPKKFVIPETSRSCSAESLCSRSCSQERCQDSCESSEEWGRFRHCGYCFDSYGWGRFRLCGRCFDSCESGSVSCSSSNSCESGSASCGCSNSSESGSGSCGCSCSCEC